MPVVDYTVVNGEILSENRAGVERDYVPDSLGSTVALLDNTQTKTDTFTYWPYGEVRTRSGTNATSFQYVGTWGYYTDSTGRTYVRARYLRTNLGRWQTEDPIWSTKSLFGYAGSNPIINTDRSGLMFSSGDCEESHKKGIDRDRPDVPLPRPKHGWVICVDMKPTPCAWTEPGTPRIVMDCILEHEQCHANASTCILRDHICRAKPGPDEPHKRECTCTAPGIQCLLDKGLNACQSSPNPAQCRKQIISWIGYMCSYYNDNCAKAGMPQRCKDFL